MTRTHLCGESRARGVEVLVDRASRQTRVKLNNATELELCDARTACGGCLWLNDENSMRVEVDDEWFEVEPRAEKAQRAERDGDGQRGQRLSVQPEPEQSNH